MKKLLLFSTILISYLILTSCSKETKEVNSEQKNPTFELVKERIKAYAPVEIKADLSNFNEKDKQLIEKLVEAGKIADEIFWHQSAFDAIAVRDSLRKLKTPEDSLISEYVRINYGPYDVIFGNERFLPGEPKVRFAGAGFYPQDMTKEEFEKAMKENPKLKEVFQSQYSVITRNNGKLEAVPYNKYYKEVELLAKKLEEASELTDDPALKKYLQLRAKAVSTDDYFESDMAWMDVKGNIDIVIGPIETYQDALFGYKASYEAVVMVKDQEATKEFEMFKSLVGYFEKNLPEDPKYIRNKFSDETQLNIVNVVYFGGDCQKGTKTIAASLPNDPKVRDAKGGKNSMYKNMMEAKFDKTLIPIAQIILEPNLMQFVDKKAFTSFVTLHEFSHTLGRGYVYGNDKLEVRTALKERFSPIEECKADILSMYNHLHLLNLKKYTAEYIKKAQVTYLAGLYRSIRFGTESAHAKANLIQLNYLKEKGAILIGKSGKYSIDENKFWDAVKSLANEILTIEATGDYNKAGEFLAKYAVASDEIKRGIELLKSVPRDIDSKYMY
ncbi:MAG: dipeptidyl-peptidase 3 family protein [Candidatus Kapaibacteriota bacterium]